MYTRFEDELKTLTFIEIWKYLHNLDSTKSMMKHKFNDYGSIKSNVLTLQMRLNNNTNLLRIQLYEYFTFLGGKYADI